MTCLRFLAGSVDIRLPTTLWPTIPAKPGRDSLVVPLPEPALYRQWAATPGYVIALIALIVAHFIWQAYGGQPYRHLPPDPAADGGDQIHFSLTEHVHPFCRVKINQINALAPAATGPSRQTPADHRIPWKPANCIQIRAMTTYPAGSAMVPLETSTGEFSHRYPYSATTCRSALNMNGAMRHIAPLQQIARWPRQMQNRRRNVITPACSWRITGFMPRLTRKAVVFSPKYFVYRDLSAVPSQQQYFSGCSAATAARYCGMTCLRIDLPAGLVSSPARFPRGRHRCCAAVFLRSTY